VPDLQVEAAGGGTSTAPRLDRGEVYRFEIRYQRTGTATANIYGRIYNDEGTLIYDETDWFLLNQPIASTAMNQRGITMGTNGWSADSNENWVAWYQGGVAVRADDWVGPYIPGEGR
jgi:hypothetical protein